MRCFHRLCRLQNFFLFFEAQAFPQVDSESLLTDLGSKLRISLILINVLYHFLIQLTLCTKPACENKMICLVSGTKVEQIGGHSRSRIELRNAACQTGAAMDWPMAPGYTDQCCLLCICMESFQSFCTEVKDQAHDREHHGMDRGVRRAAQAHSSMPTQ